jgi:hypothetical protein
VGERTMANETAEVLVIRLEISKAKALASAYPDH